MVFAFGGMLYDAYLNPFYGASEEAVTAITAMSGFFTAAVALGIALTILANKVQKGTSILYFFGITLTICPLLPSYLLIVKPGEIGAISILFFLSILGILMKDVLCPSKSNHDLTS